MYSVAYTAQLWGILCMMVVLLGACSDSSDDTTIESTDQDRDGLTLDEDCDDTDPNVGGPERYFRDDDGDGMGDDTQSMESCEPPADHVATGGDPEPDCVTNDTDACGVCGGPGGSMYYADVDNDGMGDPRSGVRACAQPEGYTDNDDDQEPDCATNNTDDCGVCAGPGRATFYADVDGDGLGDARTGFAACERPEGWVDNGDDLEPDCVTNDTDACGICGGPGGATYYADVDGDGQGDDRVPVSSCGQPDGFVDNADDPEPDCATNDTDECGVCGGGNADRDCNGVCFGGAVIDDCGICGGPGLIPFYTDTDGDGLGDPDGELRACSRPEGYVDNADDQEPECTTNDTDECDVCAGPGKSTYYADTDNDNLGDPRTPIEACEAPDGFVDNADDPEPDCTTNDTDDCGVCGGNNANMDCNNVCDGDAFEDICGRCAGGDTGLEPASEEDADGDGTPDDCANTCLDQARFIAQWTAVPPFARGGSDAIYTFQVILFENGDILFQHADHPVYSASPTVGIQSAGGEHAIEFGHNSDYVVEQPVTIMYRDRDDRFIADYAQERYWLDISQVGTRIQLNDDDETSVELGFNFPFWDQQYSTVSVSSNGFLFFGDAGCGSCYQNDPLPNSGLGAIIAPFWDDLNPASGGDVYVYAAPPTCEADCNGVVGGFAYYNEEPGCNTCVTGIETGPSIDCNGVCGGRAEIDGCGICAGGDTGIEPQQLDCEGVCGGSAYIDDCRVCVGGNTGLEPTDPAECPTGVDLTIDALYLEDTVYIDYINV
ncbi:MAG: hypothetical protein AAFS10_09180, partial [Myxococcota bacterium]